MDPITELSNLLHRVGAVPYLHAQDCAVWQGGDCTRQCGERARGAYRRYAHEQSQILHSDFELVPRSGARP